MSSVTADDFLSEIRHNALEKDTIKARFVLNYLGDFDLDTQRRVLMEICKADDEFAIPLLTEIMSNIPGLAQSFPTIRQTLVSKVLLAPEYLAQILESSKSTISAKSFLAELAGEVKLKTALPILVNILSSQTDELLLESTLRALGRMNDPRCVSALAEYLWAENEDLIHTAAVALGNIGSAVAVQRLSERLGRDMHLDLLIIDILVGIQSPLALESLSRTLGSKHAYLRVTAKKKLAEIGVKAIPPLAVNLESDDVDMIIHSLNVMGDIGSAIGVPPVRQLLHNDPENANVRFAAYEALGRMPLQKQSYALAPGLLDPVDNVRAAAASAIDRSFNLTLKRGLGNMLRVHEEESGNIVLAVITTQSANIFMGLIDQEEFRGRAMMFLAKEAHPDVRRFFTDLLIERGYSEIAESIFDAVEDAPKTKTKVMAVDDSKMILKIMRGMLHKIGCDSVLHEFPSKALQDIHAEKPDILFTDLNMPDITGIELTRQVRRQYGKDDLPIVMITTQHEATEETTAYEAGVNMILHKPFTEHQIREVLEKYTGK